MDDQIIHRFNGHPSADLTVFKVGDQDIVNIAEMVRAYIDGRNRRPFKPQGLTERLILMDKSGGLKKKIGSRRLDAWELGVNSQNPLPPGAMISANTDFARFVEGRLDLLVRNAKYGAMLVFATLLLFLNWRVALWVGVGLFTALMGTLVMMAWTGVTLNLLTMFGLIVVLGLLVDDAIVVAENIQARHDRGEPALKAAVAGTEQVLWPVIATVLTSVVAFLPLTFIRGHIGDFIGCVAGRCGLRPDDEPGRIPIDPAQPYGAHAGETRSLPTGAVRALGPTRRVVARPPGAGSAGPGLRPADYTSLAVPVHHGLRGDRHLDHFDRPITRRTGCVYVPTQVRCRIDYRGCAPAHRHADPPHQ